MITCLPVEERSAKRDRLGDPRQMLDRPLTSPTLAATLDEKLIIGDVGSERSFAVCDRVDDPSAGAAADVQRVR